jgi:hypothetical protein
MVTPTHVKSRALKFVVMVGAFGVHEALDQFGALFGPLAVAAVLAVRGEYRIAFAALPCPRRQPNAGMRSRVSTTSAWRSR